MTELCLVGEGGVQDDAQVWDLWGRGDGTSTNVEDVTHLLEKALGCDNHKLGFIAVV